MREPAKEKGGLALHCEEEDGEVISLSRLRVEWKEQSKIKRAPYGAE